MKYFEAIEASNCETCTCLDPSHPLRDIVREQGVFSASRPVCTSNPSGSTGSRRDVVETITTIQGITHMKALLQITRLNPLSYSVQVAFALLSIYGFVGWKQEMTWHECGKQLFLQQSILLSWISVFLLEEIIVAHSSHKWVQGSVSPKIPKFGLFLNSRSCFWKGWFSPSKERNLS